MTIDHHPTGFPYILFVEETEQTVNYLLAHDEFIARKKCCKGAKTYPLNVIDLTTNFGHQTARHFLLKFDQNWICRDGKIFFKKDAYERHKNGAAIFANGG